MNMTNLAVWQQMQASPLVWVTLTLCVYILAQTLYRRSGSHPALLPIFTSVVLIVGVLLLSGTPFPVYEQGTSLLLFMIGPATVALAVPLYSQLPRLKALWKPIAVALVVGCFTAIVSAVAIAWAFGASAETMLSLAPKSATLPIAIEVAALTGGIPSLTTVAVGITGITGAIMTGPILKLFKLSDPVIHGFTKGLSAHAIGTARALQVGETNGAFSALGLCLNGIATALATPLVLRLLGF